MLILGSYGLGLEENRQKIGALLGERAESVLIVSLACEAWQQAGEAEKESAEKLGFRKDHICLFDPERPDALPDVQFDCIVVPGGNTFRLLHGIRAHHLDALIKRQVAGGAVYCGFSAGAYLACRNIEYVRLFDDNNHIHNGDFTALGLTEKYVLCHSDDRGFAEIRMCRQFIGDTPELITIRNDQLVVLQ